MINKDFINNNVAQGIGAYVDYMNNIRLQELAEQIEIILKNETISLAKAVNNLEKALARLDLSKLEIKSLIEGNRGGETGIHGFIAEYAEVGIRNARKILSGLQEEAVLINNNGPADILLRGKEVQMKFYNNISKSIKQSANYRNMKMMFPKDQVEVITKIMDGVDSIEINGNKLNKSSIKKIRDLIEEESRVRGVSFKKWLVPSVNDYSDIQKGTINKTLDGECKTIKIKTTQEKNKIKKEANDKRFEAQKKAKPTFKEANKAAGVGAAVQGGTNFIIFVYQKHKAGKEIWKFDAEDWKECGLTTGKGAMKGGVSGYAVYGLSNVCNLSAPSAAAVVSGTFGLYNAVIEYRNGNVDTDGFIDLVVLNAVDASGAAIGAAIGATIISTAIIGPLVGSIAITTALSIGKDVLNKNELEALENYQNKIDLYINKLDQKYKIELEELKDKYNVLGDLQQYSFDLDINIKLRFIASIELAEKMGVPEEKILKSETEIDEFFLTS